MRGPEPFQCKHRITVSVVHREVFCECPRVISRHSLQLHCIPGTVSIDCKVGTLHGINTLRKIVDIGIAHARKVGSVVETHVVEHLVEENTRQSILAASEVWIGSKRSTLRGCADCRKIRPGKSVSAQHGNNSLRRGAQLDCILLIRIAKG